MIYPGFLFDLTQQHKGKGRDRSVGDGYGTKPPKVSWYGIELVYQQANKPMPI